MILWGLKKQGDEYEGGAILDPESDKVYRAKMKLDGDGGKLGVRGFIGFSSSGVLKLGYVSNNSLFLPLFDFIVRGEKYVTGCVSTCCERGHPVRPDKTPTRVEGSL